MHSQSNRTCMTQRPTCRVTRNAALCDVTTYTCMSFVRFTLFYACTTCNRPVHVCLPFINTVAICINCLSRHNVMYKKTVSAGVSPCITKYYLILSKSLLVIFSNTAVTHLAVLLCN